MDIRVGNGLSQTQSGSIEKSGDAWILTVTELALELPTRVARLAVTLLHTGRSVRGREGISVPPMSADWLHDLAEDSGKHDDRL